MHTTDEQEEEKRKHTTDGQEEEKRKDIQLMDKRKRRERTYN